MIAPIKVAQQSMVPALRSSVKTLHRVRDTGNQPLEAHPRSRHIAGEIKPAKSAF
jgi:hypothetical protein